MSDAIKQAGEIWDVSGRKGELAIALCEDVTPETDFFDAVLVDGAPKYRGARRHDPEIVGDPISMRNCLTTWVRKREPEKSETEASDGD